MRRVLIVVACAALAGCPAPRQSVPNSADAARACLDLVRSETGDDALELEDPNHARLEGNDRVLFQVLPTEAFYDCRFTFSFEEQSYTARTFREADGLRP